MAATLTMKDIACLYEEVQERFGYYFSPATEFLAHDLTKVKLASLFMQSKREPDPHPEPFSFVGDMRFLGIPIKTDGKIPEGMVVEVEAGTGKSLRVFKIY